MTSETKIRHVLDMITTAPAFQLESLRVPTGFRSSNVKSVTNKDNIVGVGIAEKVSGEKRTGNLALTFYVRKKMLLSELRADQAVPSFIPDVLGGKNPIQTDVVELGDIIPQVNAVRNPIQPGNSVGHVSITCGTLGAIVTDGKDYFLLSNSHVLAMSGQAKAGDKILYPGAADNGVVPADVIAGLTRFVPFTSGKNYVNKVDCAIAKINDDRLTDVISAIKNKNIPAGVIKPKRGMKVFKVGRTTDYTEAEIRDVDLKVPVPYEDGVGEIRFTNQVLCTTFTDGGDSGSLVIDKQTGKAVGLHFCGGSQGSIFNPIAFVLEALNVKLLTKEISNK